VRFVSTRGKAPPADLRTALIEGLAPEGGLYLPERLEPLPERAFTRRARFADAAAALAGGLFDDVPEADRVRIAEEALDFEIPLVRLSDELWVAELFHGRTLAFKDVAARFMAHLLAWLLRDEERPLVVLAATSGDTGSAVASAFQGQPRTRVAVLYPRGQVSPLQERQFTTLGGNVAAFAVEGTFDDCQRLAKGALADRDLRARLVLVSANSINVGRLLPQTFYYAHAAAALPPGPPPLFSVPSGNFGNLTAGLIAERLGLRCAGFAAATNLNDAVPRYLETGRYEPRPSQRTLSNAMDVGNPSNFERLLALFGGDLEAMRRRVKGSRHDDGETRAAIREAFERFGYVLDPHSAVGYLALKAALAGAGGRGILLATAHPAKFREQVGPVIGREVPLPERLAACLAREPRSIPLAAEARALKERLLD